MTFRPAFSCSLALSLGLLAPPARASEPASPPAAPADAAQLVAAALEAELAGDAARRAELLAQAVAADVDYAPARWQSGQVKFEGKWRTVAEVAERVGADPRWHQYDELRQSLAGTPQDHGEVARWCYRQGLENEERYHWMQVIAANPEHKLARTRLGVREYQGGLYTHGQIAEHEAQTKQSKANLKKFRPIVAEICKRTAEGSAASRAAALDELSRLTDSAALESLLLVLGDVNRGASTERTEPLCLAIVAAISHMPDHPATLALLNLSVFSPSAPVRYAAAQGLKPRPVTDYVPLLMAALTAPIEAEIEAFRSIDGTVFYDEKLFQAGPEADVAVNRNREFVLIPLPNTQRIPNRGQAPAIERRATRNYQLAASHAVAARNRVALANAEAMVRNERIREVLRNAIGLELGADPNAYWKAWTDYNELYSEDRPRYELTDSYAYLHYVPPMSCFIAGTPVWTQAGPKAINEIVVGDLVLSQHPVTGELAYRPVTLTTVRPPSRLAELAVGGETVTTTLGHRAWVEGRGWEMAKFLSAEQSLRSLAGATPIQRISLIDESEGLEAYNLVVDEFHTYFVGETKLLVHDNSCPQPTTALVPGLAAPRKATSAAALAGN